MKNPFSKPESVARHLKIAVTGKSGQGKTCFGLDAKNHGLGPVAVLSNEAGDVHYIKHPRWGGFDRLPTQKLEEMEEAIKYVEENPGAYGTLVVDTVTGIYEGLVQAKAKDDGSVNVKSWGLIKRKWRSLMARLNNLPINIVAVVHENDLVEVDPNGSSRVVGQKLDAEKTFERNPDVLIRVKLANGKRSALVLKDRTGTYQTGQVVEDAHIGLWAKAIKSGPHEARIAPPDEVDAENAAAVDAAPSSVKSAPPPAANAPTPAPETATLAGLLAEITAHDNFNAKQHADNWWKQHWEQQISKLAAAEQRVVRRAIDSKIKPAKEGNANAA